MTDSNYLTRVDRYITYAIFLSLAAFIAYTSVFGSAREPTPYERFTSSCAISVGAPDVADPTSCARWLKGTTYGYVIAIAMHSVPDDEVQFCVPTSETDQALINRVAIEYAKHAPATVTPDEFVAYTLASIHFAYPCD